MAPLIDPVRMLLSAKDRDFLESAFARNQARFGGYTMKADPDPDPKDPKDGGNQTEDPAPKDDPDEDKPLGPNGEKALKSERDARKAVAAELATLKQGLAAALGTTAPDGGKPSTDDALAEITSQLADMKHENTVLALANQHKITDPGDIDLLRATRDGDALAKLAARLATPTPTGGNDGGKPKPGTPKPDPTQGGDRKPHGKPTSVAQVIADRRSARAAKTPA